MSSLVNQLYSIVVVVLVAASTAASAGAWQCESSQRSTDLDRFDDNQDGTLTDIKTGLTWMRCGLGQTWQNGKCIGELKRYTWSNASLISEAMNAVSGYAGYNDWRLPQLPQLAGIIERYCNNPRINLQLFPSTPAAPFWTRDTRVGQSDSAWTLDFGLHGIIALSKTETALVRLVRGP